MSSVCATCPLCLALYRDPITLPTCGHVFCRDCVAARTSCPLCRAALDTTVVATLVSDVRVAALIATATTVCSPRRCDWCNDAPATLFCPSGCQGSYYCVACDETVHEHPTARPRHRQHARVPSTFITVPPDVNRCECGSRDPFVKFCFTEGLARCGRCVVGHCEVRGHDICDVSSVGGGVAVGTAAASVAGKDIAVSAVRRADEAFRSIERYRQETLARIGDEYVEKRRALLEEEAAIVKECVAKFAVADDAVQRCRMDLVEYIDLLNTRRFPQIPTEDHRLMVPTVFNTATLECEFAPLTGGNPVRLGFVATGDVTVRRDISRGVTVMEYDGTGPWAVMPATCPMPLTHPTVWSVTLVDSVEVLLGVMRPGERRVDAYNGEGFHWMAMAPGERRGVLGSIAPEAEDMSPVQKGSLPMTIRFRWEPGNGRLFVMMMGAGGGVWRPLAMDLRGPLVPCVTLLRKMSIEVS